MSQPRQRRLMRFNEAASDRGGEPHSVARGAIRRASTRPPLIEAENSPGRPRRARAAVASTRPPLIEAENAAGRRRHEQAPGVALQRGRL